jgi:dTMP kinase
MSNRLITVEGIDGAGKTSIIEGTDNVDGLKQRLDDAYFTTEPKSGTWLGDEVVRPAIYNEGPEVPSVSVFFLFLAEHANHVEKYVEPELEKRDVICDRYIDSRYVYQSQELEDDVSGDTLEWIKRIQEQNWSIMPDLTILLDVSVETSLSRLDGDEIFEKEDKLKAFREVYNRLAEEEERYVVVDAEQDLESVVEDCMEFV